MKLVTLADVLALDRAWHLPTHFHDKTPLRVGGEGISRRHRSASIPAEVSIALRMALSLEGVKCQPT
jgi:hypothetical protein